MELPAVEITNLSKTFGTNTALKRVSLTIGQGEMVALIGPSGSGKSTLLRHLSGLVSSDRHEKSIIKVMGKLVQRDGIVSGNIRMIRSDVGFIFQQFNLVGRLSLLTNILTGMLSRIPVWRSLFGVFLRREKMAAMEALRRVGIDNYAGQRASTLSGGQQQRGAIARALLQKAKLILADEPIASLDPQSATLVMEALRSLNREDLLTVVVSLHQIDFAFRYCPRAIALKDGQVIYDGPTRDLTVELLREVYGSDYLEIDRADGGRWNPSGGSESDGPQEPSRAMSAA
jgi:phosphonate transport system ATP-binding protein